MKRYFLTAFVLSPLAVLAGLTWLIARSIGTGDLRRNYLAATDGAAPAVSHGYRGERAREPESQPQGAVAPESLEQGFILIVDDRSGLAGPASPIFLASNHVGWNPGDPSMRLEAQSDMKWRIVLPKPTSGEPLLFKFTRGSWETVEVAPDLVDIQNRSLPRIDASRLGPGEKPRFEFTITAWADQRPSAATLRSADPLHAIEAVGTVRRLQVVGGGGSARGARRDLLVWLPPGYDTASNEHRRYPVLYLHDGQNVFERPPGVPGEWRADETATGLIEEAAIEPLIIVGIPHGGSSRSSEYLPVPLIDGVEPAASEHVAWLRREVMPRVERAFRIKPGPQNTAIGGSSLGAIISLYAVTEHPDVFGKVLAESPTLLHKNRLCFRFFQGRDSWPPRIYVGMSGSETGGANPELDAEYRAAAHEFAQMLTDKGLTDVLVRVDSEGVHNEDAWASRLPVALLHLFPAPR